MTTASSSSCYDYPTTSSVMEQTTVTTSLIKTCVDIDECAAGLTLCDYPDKCVNEEGGYRCDCPPEKWLFTPDRTALVSHKAFLAINQSCINQRCQAPPPSNDRMVRSPTHGLYLVNSTVLYYCTEGNIYESAYQPIAYTCQSSGQWSFVQFGQVPQPNCSKIPCDDPRQSFYNGRLTTDQQTFFAGDIVEYTCESNYLLVGPNRRVCFQYPFENRPRWVSHSAPKCIAISCPRIAAPMDGTMFVSQSEFIVGSTAWFACRPGFELIGSSVLSCQSDQTWSNSVPTCEAKKCAIDPPPSMEVAGALNALNRQRRQFNIDEQVSLRCLGEGFALSDAAPLKCMLPNSAASSQRDMSGGTSKYSSMMQVEYTTSATTSTPCKSALQAQAGHELRTTLSSLPNCTHIDLAVHDVGGSPDHTLQFIVALTGSGPTAPCMQLIKAHINKQMKEIHPDDEPLCSGAAKIVISLNVTNDIVSTNQGDSPLNQQYRRRQRCIEMISSNTVVLEGVTVDLWCVMSANCDQKMFNIMWTKGSNELALRQTDDSRIEVVQTDTRIVDVRIAPVRPIDNDTYSCKIWDKARGDVVEKMVLKLEVVPNGKVNNPERINPESLQPNTTILYNSTNNAQRNSWQVYSASSEAGWIVLPDHHSALLRICSSNNQHADSWVRSPFIRVPNGVSDQVIRVRLSYVHQRCPNDGCAENIRVLWWQTNEMLAPWTVNDFEQIFELPFDETMASFELPAPISKIGLYFAFQGTGSCTTIFDLDVRSVACPRYAVDLSVFPNTPAPGAAAGSRFVDADCVDGAVAIPIASKLQCTVEGRWKNISAEGVPTVCICKPGYVRHGNMCEKQGPLCYECSNANSLLECASTPDRVRHCAVDDVCRTTVSHLANGQLVLDKGCAPANECTVSITNWSTCLRGEDDCTLCCNDDYCNFPPNAAAGNASAIPNFDRPVPNCRDVVPPTFYDCPKNITVSIGMKNFTLPTVVSWPKFKDNQHNVVITSTLADLTSDSYIFNQSVKEVNWTVTDQAGLKSVCSVPVIYKDSIAPIVKCPSDAIIVNVSSSTSPETPISFPAVAVLDASAIQSITYTPANGSLVPIDRPIEVIATAVDKFGNTGSCHFWFMATVSDCPHWMINKDEYSCLPTPVGRSIMCVSNKSCKNGRKMYPIDVDVISCSSNGQWHRLSRSNNQSFDNINDNPSLPLLPRCIDLAAPPVSFEVILNISGHIEKACLEPLINATKDKLGQLIRENCGNQFEYTVVFQSGESQWKPGLSRPVYQVTIPGTVETIVPDAQVHLAKVCISQFASRLSTMPPIFEPTECSTIQLVSQAGILKEGDTKCEPGWILVDSTEQLPSLCRAPSFPFN
uniref:Uncharacterized protein n=1 Tax=Plectus sambesii TaxID=2011161 RepID=A0A914WZJ1_9BILA